MLTMTRTKIENETIQQSFDDKVRAAEAALLRIADGLAEPGDVARIRDVGWNSPEDQRTQLDRLRGVRRALEAVGSADDLRKSRQRYEAAEAAATKSVPVIDGDIAKLRERIQELQAQRDALTGEVESSQADLNRRMNELNRLRSPVLLPQHINDELTARKRSMNSATAARQQELAERIAKLRADGQRLKNQTNSDGSVSSPDQLAEYVDRAAADVGHRAHEFWRDRVLSMAEWANFDAWCQRVAGEYETELASIKAHVAESMQSEAEALASFYTAAIE